ncbi:MAG TPA: ABC transporter ATP-binding protein [Bryobacteraceae bacterium]|nr:ABC transporter ATP-binding protein [Bryobacteraceae bacterium]
MAPEPHNNAIIRAVNLTRRFDALTAVDHLNLEVLRGEIFGIVGPDGAGKTTTLRLLCGLMDATEGEAWVTARNVAREPDAVKDQIGYMAQRFGLYGDLTVDENMNFYADLFGISKAERSTLMPQLLRMTRMEPFGKRLAMNLSGGMKQKLALMCTLLHHPQVLFLDEPTNGVDPVSRRDFWAILYRLVRDGLTVLITTAYLDEAERCNRVGLMDKGRMIRCESPRALKFTLEETCYEIDTSDQRAAREFLQSQPGVLSVEPAGAKLHLFLDAAKVSPESLQNALSARQPGPVEFRRIVPSLEDVFIGLIRKEEMAHAG